MSGTLSPVRVRAEILFKQGKIKKRFANSCLIKHGDKPDFGHGARTGCVLTVEFVRFGRRCTLKFSGRIHDCMGEDVRNLLSKFGDDLIARRERMHLVLRTNRGLECDYEEFKQNIADYCGQRCGPPASCGIGLWRLGSRRVLVRGLATKAFGLSPTEYGYCLNRLNFGRYAALPTPRMRKNINRCNELVPGSSQGKELAIRKVPSCL